MIWIPGEGYRSQNKKKAYEFNIASTLPSKPRISERSQDYYHQMQNIAPYKAQVAKFNPEVRRYYNLK